MSIKTSFGNVAAHKTYLRQYLTTCVAVILTATFTLTLFFIPLTTHSAPDCDTSGYLVGGKCVFFSKGDDVYSEHGCIESKKPLPGYKSIPCPAELIDMLERESEEKIAEEQKSLEERNRLEEERIELIVEEKIQETAAVERHAEISKALGKCDLDFFETMTTDEKMDTFREREACKIEATSEAIKDVVKTPATDPTPVQSIESPVTTLPPIITAPATVSAPELATEAETISDTEASNGPETIETEAEPPVAPELEEPVDTMEPATPPSFFQRVINFFTSWF